MAATTALLERRRPKGLAFGLVESLSDRIRDGRLAPGAQIATEAKLMSEFGVSRSVVREAISKLQAAALVETRHGVGSFVVGAGGDAAVFRIRPDQLATLRDVVAMLELRIGIETEAAGLAADRRSRDHLREMRDALAAFSAAVDAGQNAVGADFRFHLEIARATGNGHFENMLRTFSTAMIPRARLDPQAASAAERTSYLRRVHVEHHAILDAIADRDSAAARTAMRTHLAASRERRRRAGGIG